MDDSRTYLMGHSMGGAGTFFLGSKHAKQWTAIAPIAPASFLMNNNRTEILKGSKDSGVPIFVTTGDADEAVPVTNTRRSSRSKMSGTESREPAMTDIDKRFTGSVPKIYETCLVPLIFEPYAADLQARVGSMGPSRILETAAGTGVVTRALAAVANLNASIVATDLNQAMLDEAAATGTARPVEWQRADAMALPFPDDDFDAVVCQFGVMFFPDKAKAFAEARRVLKPGGVFLFNVWDRISENQFADTVTNALVSVFPDDPPRFLARTPHGYHDVPTIQRDLAAGGFTSSPQIETVAARSRADSAHVPALAYCQGTPLRNEIEARDASRLVEATDVAAAAVAQQFGAMGVDGKLQAHVVTIRR